MLLLAIPIALLPQAHAHNDYAHKRPLLDALDQGFLSVEADIYLLDGELRVGHDRKDLKPGRTLESLYLDPLAARIRENKGSVYSQSGMLTLLVDIKEDGAAVQGELRKRLPKYASMLTERTGPTIAARAVQIVLSGARTADCAAGDGFLFKDGTGKDLADPAFRTPLISESYTDVVGAVLPPFPAAPKAKLDEWVKAAHAGGKRVRLWGTPDAPATWGALQDAGLDLINTDRLADLRAFLLSRPPYSG